MHPLQCGFDPLQLPSATIVEHSQGNDVGFGGDARKGVGLASERAGDEGFAVGTQISHGIEIVHESLLRAWPRLVRWQTQDEEEEKQGEQSTFMDEQELKAYDYRSIVSNPRSINIGRLLTHLSIGNRIKSKD